MSEVEAAVTKALRDWALMYPIPAWGLAQGSQAERLAGNWARVAAGMVIEAITGNFQRGAIEQGKKRELVVAGSPGHEATLADWLSFRGLPAGSSLLTLIEHERGNAALAGAFNAIAAGAPGRRSLTIGKRYFGNVRQLPSGRWQARYDAAGTPKKAPETFARREDAQAWLDDLAAKQKPAHPECPTCVCRPDPEQDETPST